MTTDIQSSPVSEAPKAGSPATIKGQPPHASRLFWGAPLLAIAALIAFFVQAFGLRLLFTPWYVPIGGTAAVVLALWSIGSPLRWGRILVTAGCLLLACLEWAFLLGFSVLPIYAGPLAEGRPLPAFHATLADGTEITESYFQQGETTALIFFQGRWCPFCMTHLRELEAHHGEFDRVNTKVVVVSIEGIDKAAQSQREFPHLTVISDKRRELAEAVDVINDGFGPEGEDSAAPTILLLNGQGKALWLHRPTRFISRPSAAELAAEILKRRQNQG